VLELSPWWPGDMQKKRRSANQCVLASHHNADPCKATTDHNGGLNKAAIDPAAALICQYAELASPLLD